MRVDSPASASDVTGWRDRRHRRPRRPSILVLAGLALALAFLGASCGRGVAADGSTIDAGTTSTTAGSSSTSTVASTTTTVWAGRWDVGSESDFLQSCERTSRGRTAACECSLRELELRAHTPDEIDGLSLRQLFSITRTCGGPTQDLDAGPSFWTPAYSDSFVTGCISSGAGREMCVCLRDLYRSAYVDPRAMYDVPMREWKSMMRSCGIAAPEGVISI